MWVMAMTLWLPSINYGKTYRDVAQAAAMALPPAYQCVQPIRVGDAQLASFAYFGHIRFGGPNDGCDVLLRHDSVDYGEPGNISHFAWRLIWEGRRPADRDERFRMYRLVDTRAPSIRAPTCRGAACRASLSPFRRHHHRSACRAIEPFRPQPLRGWPSSPDQACQALNDPVPRPSPYRQPGRPSAGRPACRYRLWRHRYRDGRARLGYRPGRRGPGRLDLHHHLYQPDGRIAGAVAHRRAALWRRPHRGDRREVRQAAWLGAALAIPGVLLLAFPAPLLAFAKAPPELVEKATAYLHFGAFGLPAALGFRIYSALNNALSRPIMVTVLQIGGLALKVPLNAWFIHGGLGLPAMGGPGCGLASTLISWAWCIAGLLILRYGSAYHPLRIFSTWSWPAAAPLRALLRLGAPMGLTYLIEITSFTLMSIFITRLGTVTLAGHQIIANLGAVAYMLPLSLGIATSTLVAQHLARATWSVPAALPGAVSAWR